MSEWSEYRKTQITEMRPYKPGESVVGISITPGVEPKEGGMIARDPTNHADQWYITPEFFQVNYVAHRP